MKLISLLTTMCLFAAPAFAQQGFFDFLKSSNDKKKAQTQPQAPAYYQPSLGQQPATQNFYQEERDRKRQACLDFINSDPKTQRLNKSHNICESSTIQDLMEKTVQLNGIDKAEYRVCLVKFIDLQLGSFSFIRDCADPNRISNLLSPQFNQCLDKLSQLTDATTSYNQCQNRDTLSQIQSPHFAICTQRVNKLNFPEHKVISTCLDGNKFNKIISQNAGKCIDRIYDKSMHHEYALSLCLNSNIQDYITHENFGVCTDFFIKSGVAKYNSALLCTNKDVLPLITGAISTSWFNFDKKPAKPAAPVTMNSERACLIHAFRSSYKFDLFYALTSNESNLVREIIKDCQQNPATKVVSSTYFHLLKDHHISSSDSFDQFSGRSKLLLGGISSLSFDHEDQLLYMLSDDNDQNYTGNNIRTSRMYVYKVNSDLSLKEERVVFFKNKDGSATSMDPEGLYRTKDGFYFVSSEFGEPTSTYQYNSAKNYNINIFNPEGIFVGHVPLAESFKFKFDEQKTTHTQVVHNPQPSTPPQMIIGGQQQNTGIAAAPAQAQAQADKKTTTYTVTSRKMTQGLTSTKGLEALTMSPSEDFLFVANEGPLLQDRTTSKSCDNSFGSSAYVGDSDEGNPSATYSYGGRYCGGAVRIVKYKKNRALDVNMTTEINDSYVYDSEYRYDLENLVENGLVEMLALDNNTLLTLERSWDSTKQKVTSRIYMVKLSMGLFLNPQLPLKEDDNQPTLKKTLVLDLDELIPGFVHGSRKLDNMEAMSFGPKYNGNPTLIIASDNNFSHRQKTMVLFLEMRPELFQLMKNLQ